MTKKSFALLFDSVCEILYAHTLSEHDESKEIEDFESNILSPRAAGDIPLFCTVSLVLASNLISLVDFYTSVKVSDISFEMIHAWVSPMLQIWIAGVSSSSNSLSLESEIQYLLRNIFEIARRSTLGSVDNLSMLQAFVTAILIHGRNKVLNVYNFFSKMGIQYSTTDTVSASLWKVVTSVVSAMNFCALNIPLLTSRSKSSEYRCSCVINFICIVLIECCDSLLPNVSGSITSKSPCTPVPAIEAFCQCCFNFNIWPGKSEFLFSTIEEIIKIIYVILSKLTSVSVDASEVSLVLFSVASVVNILNIGVTHLLSQWSHLIDVSVLLHKVISMMLSLDTWAVSLFSEISRTNK